MKSYLKGFGGLAAVIALFAFASLPASAKPVGDVSLEGRWDATITINNVVIPFRLDISGSGEKLTGTLYNGDETQSTTGARIENGVVTLSFDHYLTKIVLTPKDGRL